MSQSMYCSHTSHTGLDTLNVHHPLQDVTYNNNIIPLSWIVGQSVIPKYFASTASILSYTLRKIKLITIHQIDRYCIACFHSVQNRLSFCLIPRNLKINIYNIITASIVLHRCETWSHSPRKEYILYVLLNKRMRKILGSNRRMEKFLQEIKEVAMVHVAWMEKLKMCRYLSSENLKRGHHLGHLKINGRRILKWCLGCNGLVMWLGIR